MKTHSQQLKRVSRTIQGKNRAANQADMQTVLQKYSAKTAQLQVLAYTQGSEVHIASGQEKHLGYKLGHVMQQKQGRMQPTMQLQGTNVNDNGRLERETDEMTSGKFNVDEGEAFDSMSGEALDGGVFVMKEKQDEDVEAVQMKKSEGVSRTYYFYQLRNSSTNAIFYVGRTVNRGARFAAHVARFGATIVMETIGQGVMTMTEAAATEEGFIRSVMGMGYRLVNKIAAMGRQTAHRFVTMLGFPNT